MPGEIESISLIQIEGVIQSIHAPCREMKVAVGDAIWQFDIAAECSVWLHGERIKLRILLAADPVHISYVIQDGERLAMQIRVVE
ncbi:MAG TPA: hypothetical protein VGP68_19880 [Gemmataceae bacterium]|jgi:hypothetical protein|nr:hypothetical protein [Gemmataceae bacterium]